LALLPGCRGRRPARAAAGPAGRTAVKALVLRQHGTLDDLAYTDVPAPEIGPDEVLLEVKAAALNRLDLWVVEGWPGLRLEFPHILGSDGAGLSTALGDRVEGYQVSDRVAVNPTVSCGHCDFCRAGREHMCDEFKILGEHVPGFYAQRAAVPARNLLALPDHVSFADAAAASLVFVTAWHMLVVAGGLRAGEDVLVVG